MTTAPDVLAVVRRGDHVAGPPQGRWTYRDYAALPADSFQYEVINGVLYVAPSPSFSHQSANMRFSHYLFVHVEQAGLGKVLAAPFDVELTPDSTVVQPDVLVILNPNLGIIKSNKITGAPDLIVEIASPATAGYDRREKQDAYARAGVKEYWLADPGNRSVEVMTLEEDGFRSLNIYQGKATLPTKIVPNFPVPVEQFFV